MISQEHREKLGAGGILDFHTLYPSVFESYRDGIRIKASRRYSYDLG